jgi:hypothetical protein
MSISITFRGFQLRVLNVFLLHSCSNRHHYPGVEGGWLAGLSTHLIEVNSLCFSSVFYSLEIEHTVQFLVLLKC